LVGGMGQVVNENPGFRLPNGPCNGGPHSDS